MKAAVVSEFQGPSSISLQQLPVPEVTAGAVLIKVAYVATNYFEYLLTKGQYQFKPKLPFVLGSEFCGTVVKIGPGVKNLSIGDAVCGLVQLGAYAEFVVVPSKILVRIPSGMTLEEASVFPATFPTAYAALVYRANTQPGEIVLVLGAGGGVGLAAVQVAKALGAVVIAAASSPAKLAAAKSAGADHLVLYSSSAWPEEVRKITGGRGVDVVYDPVGGTVFEAAIKCVAWNARVVVVGFASGVIPSLALNRLLLKNIAVTGVFWGAYATNQPSMVAPTFQALFKMYKDKRLRPLVPHIAPLEDLPRLLEAMGERQAVGRTIVRVSDGTAQATSKL